MRGVRLSPTFPLTGTAGAASPPARHGPLPRRRAGTAPRPCARACVLAACLALTANVHGDWKDFLDSFMDGVTSPGQATTVAALSDRDVVAALKEALARGAERAVSELGQTNGFLADARVRIPMPEALAPIESALRALNQDRYADEFVVTMNRAAESAVPEAGAILREAIRRMTLSDAKAILRGPDDAATRYFRSVGERRLTDRMRPIVSEATSRAGVTSAYKSLVERAGFAARLTGADSVDLDGYVTAQALNGLFVLIAEEEKRIRENPVARTSDLLEKVFGASP